MNYYITHSKPAGFRWKPALIATVGGLWLAGQNAGAQVAAKPTGSESKNDDETIVLSPFVISSEEDKGSYQATSTLAGSRVRTDLRDVASSLSVVTSDFLRDTGARNNQDLLVYTTNTEVGGPGGNFAGVGNTFIDGANESSNLIKPQGNTRVRGLDSADNTRDYFLSDIPWDSFNVGRIDLQRGPNSILFGIGSPAGIINASVNTATFKTGGTFENRIGGHGSLRDSIDYNYVLLKDQLSFRVAAVDDNTNYRQKPAYNHDRRLFAAARWDPNLFGTDSGAHTTFRANFERGQVKANRPRSMPPDDRITPYFDADKINKQNFDPYYAWAAGIVPYSSSALQAGLTKNYWLIQGQGPGLQGTANPVFVYNNGTTTPISIREGGVTTQFGVSTTGAIDSGIGGFPFGSPIGIASYNQYAIDYNRNNPTDVSTAGAQAGFYKTKSLTDPSIFDFYNNLIDGPTKKEWQGWTAYNLSAEQSFFHDRLGFQLVYDRQKYHDGAERDLGGNTYVSVDVMSNTTEYPWAYSGSTANPNANRAYVGSSAKNGGNTSSTSDRQNIRFTGTGEIRFEDFMSKSLLRDMLGHHTFTGLYSQETYKQDTRNWVRYAVTPDWSDAVGAGYTNGGSGNGGLKSGDVVLDNIFYLSGSLKSASTASGLNLSRLTADPAPSGTYQIRYYDSHWNKPTDPSAAGYVNPAAVWINPTALPGQTAESTQSENPDNYVGWVTKSYRVLNADKGDLDSLYTDGSKIKKKTTSKGITWQANIIDDMLAATVGWRQDKQELQSAAAPQDKTGLASMDYDLNPIDPATGVSKGDSTSWGLVLHTPKTLREKLPLGTDISFAYSNGRNTRVENRYGFAGDPLPNATGKTKDYSMIISTLNGKLTLKITRYKTDVNNANISSLPSEVTTLGSNTYYLRNLEAWGTASAMTDLGGMAGAAQGWEWYWSWAEVDHGFNGQYTNPNSAAFQNDPSTVKEKAAIQSWLAQMLPQSWFDAYGFPIDVAKAKAGDWQHAISGGSWTPTSGIGAIQPAGGGRINGVWPTGTVDNESKGWEFELTGTPIPNWNITVNASKTTASQTALGGELVEFIEASEKKYLSPAGDLRLWWGGDQTVRDYYNQNIWSAYQFQLQTNGKMVPEMSPWRVNLVTNYRFDHGAIKGFNFGGGVRWEDGKILGYALNAKKDNLDIDKPYWGSSRTSVDLWVGYERKLTRALDWRIQLNTRNVGQRAHLEALNVQPDGSPGAYTIVDGMSWTLTNTFTF